jgi:hypothetical protein
MPNALDSGMPPPAAAQEGAPGNALQQQSGPPANGAAPPAAPPPPPTHEQTVAALRHFDAIKGELTMLLKDPAAGRSDLKSKIIDGVTKLVSERMLTAPQAVQQLDQVPSDPLQQRKWMQTMLAQTVQAENGLLDHYGQGNPSLGDVAGHFAGNAGGKRDDHMEHIKALHANYSGMVH